MPMSDMHVNVDLQARQLLQELGWQTDMHEHNSNDGNDCKLKPSAIPAHQGCMCHVGHMHFDRFHLMSEQAIVELLSASATCAVLECTV